MTAEKKYEEAKETIKKLAVQFSRRHNTDEEDTFSEANYSFLLALDSFQNGKTEWSSWMKSKIWHLLQDWNRRERRRRFVSLEVDPVDPKECQDDWKRCLDKLPHATASLCDMLIDPPSEVMDELESTAPKKLLAAVRSHCCGRLGWTEYQFRKSYTEIKHSLKGDPCQA